MSTSETTISGLRYVRDYIDQPAHDRLLSAVDDHPWQLTVDHRVQVYGYHYNHRDRTAYRIGDIPVWARDLPTRLRDEGYCSRLPNQLVVNDYPPGAGIFQHIDQAVFGDVVIAISLGSMCLMRFTPQISGVVEELLLEPRSLLVLSGDARWRWQHEIPARPSDTWDGRAHPRSRRVSLTFRSVPDR